MFELDDKFFEEIGLNAMPQNEKESFKNHVQEEIQVRVGERISDGMTIEKMSTVGLTKTCLIIDQMKFLMLLNSKTKRQTKSLFCPNMQP